MYGKVRMHQVSLSIGLAGEGFIDRHKTHVPEVRQLLIKRLKEVRLHGKRLVVFPEELVLFPSGVEIVLPHDRKEDRRITFLRFLAVNDETSGMFSRVVVMLVEVATDVSLEEIFRTPVDLIREASICPFLRLRELQDAATDQDAHISQGCRTLRE